MKLITQSHPQNFLCPTSPGRRTILGLLSIMLLLLAYHARAATSYYYHVNNTQTTYGINPNDSLSWDDMLWTALSTGAPTSTWAAVSTLANAGFPRFNSTTTPYTVTVNNTEYNAGFFLGAVVTLNVNAAGSGNLYVVAGSLTTGLPVQGFFTSGGNLVINAPITGPGGVSESSGGGNLYLLGNNTYTGGTVFNSSGTLTWFNNSSSFGTGPININGTTFAPILGTGGSTITLANNWTNVLNSGVNFAADANTPVVLTGPVKLLGNLNLRNNGPASSPLTLSGEISGNGTLNLTANSGGSIVLSGPNTYTNQTTIGVGGNSGANPIVSVSSLNSVSGGAATSSLGHPITVASGTIGIGSAAVFGTLIYTGPGETSDRVINLLGTTGGATLEADGTGALILSAVNTATGAGAKTLTLQGGNAGANSIGKIVDSSGGATALVKAQAGTWNLTGANTFTGGTTVNAGTLEISGSVTGSVTNNSGVLTLDNASALASSSAILAVASGTTVNLNYSGTNAVTALVIDGVSQASGVWGAPTSAAPNQNAIFAGTGYINVLGKPVVTQQPVSGSVFEGDFTSFAFSVGVAGDLSTLTYQWKLNGVNIAGANASSYAIPSPVPLNSAGAYSCAVTNMFGFATSASAILYVMETNAYTQVVRGDGPAAYWRLDETNGTVAFDAVGGNNGGYTNVRLNQSGYAVTDSDPAIGLPASGSPRGYMQATNPTPFIINGGSIFTLETWAYFTNLTTKGRLFSTLNLASPNGYAFGILPGGAGLEFTAGAVADNDVTLGTPLATGQWYHLACVCDGSFYYFYLNGAPVGSPISIGGHAANGTLNPLQLGANPPSYTFGGGDGGAEQVYGKLDEAAFYDVALPQMQISNHFAARYATLQPPIVFAPIITPATNYQSLSAILQANAAGTLLSYQWYKAPSTLISGATDSTLPRSPLQLSDGGSYYVQVSNPAGTSNSPTAALTVLPIPTNAADLNVTNGLVLHLPFDSDYSDISGRGNSGTSVGASLIAGGAVGPKALHYETAITPGVTNYVTLGVRSDLKFSSNVDFTVSYWVRQLNGSIYTNLPFFGDAIGSTGSGSGGNSGFVFAPYETATSAGGWQLAIGGGNTMSSPSQFTTFPDSDLINDGQWHNLVHVASRIANVATYLDGVQVDSEAISFIGNIDNTNAAVIGQDPTGDYAVAAQADIDDIGVWRRALTTLEISGIYLAGVSNSVSFAPAEASAAPATITGISGATISYSGGSGSQFVLLGAADIATPAASWLRLATNTTTPGSFTIPPVGTSAAAFYRIKSE